MKTPIQIKCFVVVACAALSLTPAEHSCAQYRWMDWAEQGYCELSYDKIPVVRYMFTPLDDSSPEKRAETYKPYLHIYSPDGSRLLTKGPGGLFPHHRGIFFGFNKITYGDDRECDTWHCTNGAYQQHFGFSSLEADADGGEFESVVRWHGQDGEHFATEKRKQRISVDEGVIQIDFVSKLTPADGIETIHLDGDPQHAGVQFRATQQVPDETAKETYFVRTDGKGKLGETRNWNHSNPDDPMNEETTNRPWLALSFVVDGERYTVLYLDHPDNPKPSHYSERDYGRFGSFFVTDVTADDPLDVKYRYIVKQGEMTVDQCQALSDAFVSGG